VVAVFFPDISQFSVDLSLFKVYPPKYGCLLPSTQWGVEL